ncbi:OB-fold-containig protein [Microvirga lenta]|uniref:OB-fold-containig protein n=1 Tax=Microvirga lenta TaxID=2881337 RepID=UPI001CFF6B0F|nr:OB-fold-containig protein [Microvirga lenta]MCB5176184.1 YqiJ family protein [Microvirga lenta]
MDALLSPGYQPFAVAGLVMAGLVLIETVSLVGGFSLSHFIDKGVDVDAYDGHHADLGGAGWLGGMLGWVNAGRVPALIFLIVWLASFAVAGFVIQTVAIGVWTALPTLAASLAAFLLATPATRFTTRLVSFIIPREETYVVSNDDLVGRVAEVTLGPLDQGPPGRVKVRDAHGNWHFLIAKVADGHAPVPVGGQALLVDRSGSTFLVVPAPDELKASS